MYLCCKQRRLVCTRCEIYSSELDIISLVCCIFAQNISDMIRALIQLIFNPYNAWQELSSDSIRERYLPLLLVYPLLIITALSTYVHYWYGYTSFAEATREALITLLKFSACIVTAFVLMIKPGRRHYTTNYSKTQAHVFVAYTYTITLLSALINNILPSDFAFIQFMPVYIIWIVFQGRDYLKIPQENIFSYTVITSIILLGLPFAWDSIFDTLTH